MGGQRHAKTLAVGSLSAFPSTPATLSHPSRRSNNYCRLDPLRRRWRHRMADWPNQIKRDLCAYTPHLSKLCFLREFLDRNDIEGH